MLAVRCCLLFGIGCGVGGLLLFVCGLLLLSVIVFGWCCVSFVVDGCCLLLSCVVVW